MITKPLLASAVENLDDIKYPVIASPKLDGIRCLKIDGKVVTRNLKPIPNRYIRNILERVLPDGSDGEIIVGKTFQDCTSAVMSFDGEPEFRYNMFDYVSDSLEKPFVDRIKDMEKWYFEIEMRYAIALVSLVKNTIVSSKAELLLLEEKYCNEGYEGVMIRSINGRYKCGRSSLREGILLKIKRWADSEAEIVDFEEKMHNTNEAKIDALGHTERSTHKAGMVPAGTLGVLLAKDIHHGWDIRSGSGLNDDLRREIWENRDKYVGKIFRYKYQKMGMKDLPRFPIFEGFRDPADM